MPNSTNPEEASSQLPEELLIHSLYHEIAQILCVNDAKKSDQSLDLDVHPSYLINPFSDKLIRLNNKKKKQNDDSIQFIVEQIRFNLEKIETIKLEEKKKTAQTSGKAYRIFNIFDDPVDRFLIGPSKSASSDLKVLQFCLILGAEIVKPIALSISIIGDVWALSKAYLDETRVARKTSMGTAIVRIARSIAAIVLFTLSISLIAPAILFLLVGTTAVLYRDCYIAYQNRQEIKKQKIIIEKEEATLNQYKKMGLGNEVIERQQAVIQKEKDALDTLKNYRLKNNIRVFLDIMSLLGAALVITGMFLPIFPPIMLAGLLLMATSTTFKALDKATKDGISRTYNALSKKTNDSNDIKISTAELTNENHLIPQAVHTATKRPIKKDSQCLPASSNSNEDTKGHRYNTAYKQHQAMSPFLRPNSSESPDIFIEKQDDCWYKDYQSPTLHSSIHSTFGDVKKAIPRHCYGEGYHPASSPIRCKMASSYA